MSRRRDIALPTPTPWESLAHYQAARRRVLGGLAGKLELWRDCARPDCRRARACAGDPGGCLAAFMHNEVSEEERAQLYCLVQARRGG
ncbi:hypothetical protein [Bosea sp. (in: a-proteobacteria)]|uniref:hypothetical protein n=1 Tax=Bosea sp. (in: a-proteobacteria) TaxID=1871050 RepID=UPI002FCBE293